MVRGMYHVDHWQFAEGWDTYAMLNAPPVDGSEANISREGFVAFDQYKSMLADAEGKVSGPANVIAGFGAGATESLLAVTPFESIKTQL